MMFGFCNDIWVSWQCWLIWVLWWMNSCAISERGKECTQTFIFLASAVPETNALHSAVGISLWLLWTIFNWTLQSVSSQSNYVRQARHFWCLNHRVRMCWVCCMLNCVTVHLTVMSIRRKCYRSRHHRHGVRITLWCAFIGRLRHFCSEWQWRSWWHIKWLAQTSHSRLTIQTVDQLYL